MGDTIATPDLAERIHADGFAFVDGDAMRGVLVAEGLADWPSFAASWNDLGLDTYMADGGRYRRRRHAAFAVTPDAIIRKPNQPHYQSRDYNALNGGIERWFAPVLPETASHPALLAILSACRAMFGRLAAPPSWHVEIHQFRIEARAGEAGQPTPEGMHKDGVDYVLVLLIDRVNVASGVTSIHDSERRQLGSFTLTRPMDAALVDDQRVYHGVTPVEPIDPELSAFRDVLVVTFRAE